MKEKVLVTKTSMPPFEEYVNKIRPLWESHWLTNMGVYHNELEQRLREYLGVENIELFVNGHMALEMCLQAFNFPVGGEVITTPFTFISTTHAIIRNKLKPVFCDIKPDDYTIDETKIEELITENTVAILPVHVYGNICNVEAIKAIADKYDLKVIYDAAHAFGEKKDGVGVGNFGDASIFSFHATKVFNTIEGGAVTFKEKVLYEKLYYLKNFGIKNEEIISDVGANAKMNEFQAAMGLCNLEHINEYFYKRRKAVERYQNKLQGIEGITYLHQKENIESNYAYFPIFIEKTKFGMSRDELQRELQENNIYTRKYFYPITADSACFKRKYTKEPLKNARYASETVLALPLYSDITEDIQNEVCEIIIRSKR